MSARVFCDICLTHHHPGRHIQQLNPATFTIHQPEVESGDLETANALLQEIHTAILRSIPEDLIERFPMTELQSYLESIQKTPS